MKMKAKKKLKSILVYKGRRGKERIETKSYSKNLGIQPNLRENGYIFQTLRVLRGCQKRQPLFLHTNFILSVFATNHVTQIYFR